MSDLELLSAYVRERSQVAFSQLVERHTGLVFSVARRRVRDSHLAEDIAQQVFILLAMKAARLRQDTILSAWLYRATCLIASDTLRKEGRRLKREQAASAYLEASDPYGKSPTMGMFLEDAMQRLSARDQAVLVLRFLEDKSLQQVAEAMSLTADAAQKRVTRALEKLRQSFQRSGVSLSSLGVLDALSNGGLTASPPGLAKAAFEAALAHSNLAKTGLLTSPHTFEIMTSANLKLAAGGLILATLFITSVALYHQNGNLRREINRLNSANLASTELARTEPPPPSASEDADWRVGTDRLELLGLRGRVARLTAELRRATNHNAVALGQTAPDRVEQPDSILFSAGLTNLVPSGNTLVTGGWSREGMRGYVLATAISEPFVEGAPRKVTVRTQVIGAPDSFWESIGWANAKSDSRRSSIAAVLTPDQVDLLLTAIEHAKDGSRSNVSTVTGDDGDLMQLGWSVDDDAGEGMLMGIDVYPRLTPDSQAIELELSPSKPPAENRIHSLLRQSEKASASHGG
jgi:RNA polymerase sigma factor (sigma-70 family)